MASISCLNELVDTVIGSICEHLDALSIVELIRVGNRLLTFKLCSPYGISQYCSTSEYGSHDDNLIVPILAQLKGLKTVSIKNAKFLGKILLNLPKSTTSIELTGDDCLEACFEIRIGKEKNYLDFASRFPSLQSLSLRYPDHQLVDPSEDCSFDAEYDNGEEDSLESEIESAGDDDRGITKERDSSNGSEPDYGGISYGQARRTWLDVHLPLLPPTLTRLCLNSASRTRHIEDVAFPVTLEHLEIGYRKLKRLSWIFSLPQLRTLKLCRISEVETFEEIYQVAHPVLSTLHFILDEQFLGPTEEFVVYIQNLLPVLPALRDFGIIPTDQDWRNQDSPGWDSSFDNSVNIKTLSCIYKAKRYPQSLVELRWLALFKPLERARLSKTEILQLPPSLTILYAPSQAINYDDVGLLPQSLTSLTICANYISKSRLPPRLTSLHSPIYFWKVNAIKKLTQDLQHLRVVLGQKDAFIKTAKTELSISWSGWTFLNKDTE